MSSNQFMVIDPAHVILKTISIEQAETVQDENPGTLIVEVVHAIDVRRLKVSSSSSSPQPPRIYRPEPESGE